MEVTKKSFQELKRLVEKERHLLAETYRLQQVMYGQVPNTTPYEREKARNKRADLDLEWDVTTQAIVQWAKSYIDGIETLLAESVEEANEYLRSNGYDPDDLVRRTQERIKDALDNSPLNPRNDGEANDAS